MRSIFGPFRRPLPEIAVTAKRTGHCPACGTRRKLRRRFTSSSGRDPDPTIRALVRLALDTQAAEWAPDFTCAHHTADVEVGES